MNLQTTQPERCVFANEIKPVLRDQLGIKGKESFRWQLLAMK